MASGKHRSKKAANGRTRERRAVANDALHRLEKLTSEFDRASAEAAAISQRVRKNLAAEEAQYTADETAKRRRPHKP